MNGLRVLRAGAPAQPPKPRLRPKRLEAWSLGFLLLVHLVLLLLLIQKPCAQGTAAIATAG